MRCAALALAIGVAGPAAGSPAFAESVRYFAVWSYRQNAPSNEIPESELAGRELGYWELRLDDEGLVDEAAYHGSDGRIWLSVRYVPDDGRLYADVYNSQGQFVVRKSTQLKDRRPR
jgi:hypothetical protein